jgi:hypothetical protein
MRDEAPLYRNDRYNFYVPSRFADGAASPTGGRSICGRVIDSVPFFAMARLRHGTEAAFTPDGLVLVTFEGRVVRRHHAPPLHAARPGRRADSTRRRCSRPRAYFHTAARTFPAES